mgnify:CR=1 FL=1
MGGRARRAVDHREQQEDDLVDEACAEEGSVREAAALEQQELVGPDADAAFVGSSNVSLAALHDGIEWNLRVDRDRRALGDHGHFILVLDARDV